MSALSNKINSYAIQNGIEFNETWTNPPTQTGTVQELATTYWSTQGSTPVYQSSVGPPGGAGSLRATSFYDPVTPVNSFPSRVRNTGGSILGQFNDFDVSMGYWFKYNSLPTLLSTTQTSGNFLLLPTTSYFVLGTTYDSTNENHKLQMIDGSGSTITVLGVADTNWHYFAYRRSGTNAYYYLDGQLVFTRTENILSNNASQFQIGSTNGASLNFSNFYVASFSEIDATDVAEIWTVGSPTPVTVNYSASPITASAELVEPSLKLDNTFLTISAIATALMTEPTIATTIGDHVEVTTSILVSAILPTNITTSTQTNKNIVITEILTASTELINNVVISSGTDESISVQEMTATALLVQPFISQIPMIASATMPEASAVVDTNYYSLVKSLNPYLYVYDGKGNPTNSGYQTGTFTKDLGMGTLRDLGNNLNLVGEGKSWYGESDTQFSSSDKTFQFTTSTNAESLHELVSTGTFAWEAWIKPSFIPYFTSDPTLFFVRGPIRFALVPQIQNEFPQANTPPRARIQIQNSATGSTFNTFEINLSSTPFSGNNWAHVVVQSYDDGAPGLRRAELWINGSRYITQQYSYSDWTSTTNTSIIFGSDYVTTFGTATASFNQQGIDEVAIYSQALTNSQIINHYNFISTLSPNVSYGASLMYGDIESGDHSVLAVDNVIIAETPAISTGLFVDPLVVASINLSTSATSLTASAQNTDVTVYYGRTMSADTAIAAAEAKEGFALNTTYYDYVIANINPYRYVTFDTATPLADYGIDNDYSVVPTAIGGTIVNPDLGINGKSAKTNGSSYITDGVILKESEWNDSWGTGQNSYHSAFWFQRAADDASTTGLRVLWNLNGYKDNQHIVLYQYQNKLHIQFNNGSGTFIEQDSGTLDLFDYERHFVVVNFNHTNPVNNIVSVYVDAVLVMTIDLGAYTGSTTNASSADSGPNDEANNHPRLSVGCLITPFAATALPVVPANTKLIIDEVYWDKNAINQTTVTNLYNVMPDKTNVDFTTEAFIASAISVMPAISTTVNFVAAPATASGELVNPSLFIVRVVNVNADTATASALMGNAIGFVQVSIAADVFVATAIFDSPGLVFTVPATPMFASIELVNRPNPFILPTDDYGISVSTNGIRYELREFSPYIKYLRIVARNQKMYKDMEIL